MLEFRFSTRNLMIATGVIGFDVAVLVQAAKLGFGVEFPLFIASVLVTLNLLFHGYLKAADRINASPPEEQAERLLSLGCFLVVMMIFTIPIVFVLLMRGRI